MFLVLGMSSLPLSDPLIQLGRCWETTGYIRHCFICGYFHVGHLCGTYLYGWVELLITFLPLSFRVSVLPTQIPLKLFSGQSFQVSASSAPPHPVSEVSDVLNNLVLPLSSGRSPRAMAGACIVEIGGLKLNRKINTPVYVPKCVCLRKVHFDIVSQYDVFF